MTEQQPPAPASDPTQKTVLIVDDDESVLTLLEILVHRDGFKIELASGGEEALRKLQFKPDIVVLDLMLSGGPNGFDVVNFLHTSSTPIPPVIVITALPETKPEVVELAKDPLVAAVIHKPIHQDRLLSAIHKILKTVPPPRQERRAPYPKKP